MSDLGIEIKLASNHPAQALLLIATAMDEFPLSRNMAYQYANALIANKQLVEATAYLREQSQLYRQDADIQDLLAKAYAAQGKQALQHMALAESYALTGSLPAAIIQLEIARKAPDAQFYEQAVIDARDRELKERWKDEQEDTKNR